MFLLAHIAAGLIIGKATGNYPVSLIGAVAIDVDHTLSYFRNVILFKPKKIIAAIKDENDPWGDQRGFLHNVFLWMAITIAIYLFMPSDWLALSLGYLSHLILDALDNAVFYPFYPSKKIGFLGPIKYFSLQETAFTAFLFIIFLTI